MPPYISLNDRFDLATKDNLMIIENLKILNILDPTKDESNKMLILEIKSEDVPTFIKYQVSTKGFIFLQKNKARPHRFQSDGNSQTHRLFHSVGRRSERADLIFQYRQQNKSFCSGHAATPQTSGRTPSA